MKRTILATIVLVPAALLGLGLAAFAGSGAVSGHGPFGHGHRGHSPEAHRAHVEMASHWALDEVDATDEQVAEIDAIIDGVFADMESMRADHEEQHEQVEALLTAETIDREALEGMRQEALAHFDEASAIFVEAAADAAEVLSQQQRQDLADLMEQMDPRER